MAGNPRFISLRTKLLSPILATIFVSVTISTWMTSSMMRSALSKEFLTLGTTLSHLLAMSAQDAILGGNTATVQSSVDENKNLRGVAYIFVENEKREILAHTFIPIFPAELLSRIKNGTIAEAKIQEISYDSHRSLDISTPILRGSMGTVHVGMDLDLISLTTKILVAKTVFGSLLFAIIGISSLLLISRKSIRAIFSLSEIASKIANDGDLNLPIDLKLNDEIGTLADSFRTMVSNLKYQKEHLQELVNERTQQLTQSNKDLANHQLRTIATEKMAALGRMASGIAHEINNPLSVIVANIWHLKNSYVDQPINLKQSQEALDEIDETAKRIAKIVKGMRSFARDAQNDPYLPCSIGALIEETIVLCGNKFATNGITLRVEIANPQLMIDCQQTQISQILLNFLNNAFDAILPLTDKWIEIRTVEAEDTVRIQITDSGTGIPECLQDKITQPFFSTKGPGKGTGLGLSISRGLAEKHGGNIYLDKECPHTRFVLSIPKRQIMNLQSA